ncbi:hypothetical protein [Nocardioides sp.]|uniref:hypothetical protein n=1 Tax=Nocardioides sp. TaxID=35761 RepID=UPI0037832A0C
MSEPTTPRPPGNRPSQVTLAGWLAMVGSVLVVVLVFDRLSGLHTVETRESVEKFLAEPPGSDLDLGVDAVLTLIRTLAMVAAGCATAAAILGYQVLRRSRSARLALTVLAVPLFLAGLVTGGFVSSLVSASVVMLWLPPARAWFDGTAPAPAGPRPAPTPPIAHDTPAPMPLPPSQAAGGPAYAVPAPAARPARPVPVMLACVLTWIASGVSALALGLSGIVLALQPDVLLDEVHRQNPELTQQGVSDDMLVGVTYVMLAGFLLWCLAAVVLAVLVFRGVEWARVTLVVSAAVTAALSLLGLVVGAFLMVLTLAASGAAIALLVRPESRAWFRRPAGR